MTADQVRNRLVDDLRAAGRVRTAAIERALRDVPRHLFLPGVPVEVAYADEAVTVQHVGGVATSSASQPSMMAIMLEQLDVRPGHRVLEIGAGTGYNAALLAHLAGPDGSVTSIDIDQALVARAAENLQSAAADGVHVHCADGALGYPPAAPYDRVVLTVGCPDIRTEWVRQLAPGGRLLLPLTLRGSQVCVALDLGPDGVLRSSSARGCAFVRLRGAGAVSDPEFAVPGTGWTVRPADPALPVDPDAVAAALGAPVVGASAGMPLTANDLWDGFGLFLSLTEAGACRLLRAVPARAGGGLRGVAFAPLARGLGSPALLGPDGVAVVSARPARPAAVLAFGPGGPVLAARLLAALDAWTAAGRPDVARMTLTVYPGGDGPAAPSRQVEVLTEHCRILAGWSATAS
ncbi:methyltransferase domain-containing protein [Pseudonocardia sp.]|uniref:methyltransferase domain-containing protein n=1 Tax=Pseudonocardia sp. TaxID=60912 RepID=UPI003D127B52